VDGPLTRVLAFLLCCGLLGTGVGGYQCITGHTFSVAAQHEKTAVGRVVGRSLEKGRRHSRFNPLSDEPINYHYVFSVNGVKMDDTDQVCATPLVPGACSNNGPVLVYYSYQPFPNSRLEDFKAASADAYRFGQPALAIGLPLFVLSIAALVVLSRPGKRKNGPDAGEGKGAGGTGDVPDVIHIVPGE